MTTIHVACLGARRWAARAAGGLRLALWGLGALALPLQAQPTEDRWRATAAVSQTVDQLAATVTGLRAHARLGPRSTTATCFAAYGAQVGDGHSIGTFDGMHFNLGYTYSFSESYLPEAENRSWFLYFAPEGVYVGLQSSLASYSAVDVFAARSLFVGAGLIDTGLHPQKRLPWRTWSQLMAVGFSWGGDIGLGGLKMGTSHGISFFGTESDYTDIQPFVQYSVGNQVSFDLMGALAPGLSVWPDVIGDFMPSVSIDTRSNIPNKPRDQWGESEVGDDTYFWPVIDWCGAPDDSAQAPIDRLINRLQLTARDTGTDFYAAYGREFAAQLLPLFQRIKAAAPDLGLNDARMQQARQDVGGWRQRGQAGAGNAPSQEMIGRLLTLADAMLPALATVDATVPASATQIGFEMAYKRGYDRIERTDTEHAACVTPLNCQVGQACNVTVNTAELAALRPSSQADDFLNQPVVVQQPADEYLSTGQTDTLLRFDATGRALYSFTPRTVQRIVLGLTAGPSPITGNKTLKLCTRVVHAYDGQPPPSSLALTAAHYDCLFDWAQGQYPDWLTPANANSTSQGAYYYRHYAQSDAYLGVSTADGHSYYLGTRTANRLIDLGATGALVAAAGCQR